MILKVPWGYSEHVECIPRYAIDGEAKDYVRNKFNKKPLFIPTKPIKLSQRDSKGKPYIGLIRPKLKMIIDYTHDNKPPELNDKQIEEVRQKLIELTKQGMFLQDGLQVGIDRAGRIQLYDTECVAHESKLTSLNIWRVAKENDNTWYDFLCTLDKDPDIYGNISAAFKKSRS